MQSLCILRCRLGVMQLFAEHRSVMDGAWVSAGAANSGLSRDPDERQRKCAHYKVNERETTMYAAIAAF